MTDQGLGSWPRRRAAMSPGKAALVQDGATTTYAQLDLATTRLAHGLRAQGVRWADRVAFLGLNSVEMVVAMFATARSKSATEMAPRPIRSYASRHRAACKRFTTCPGSSARTRTGVRPSAVMIDMVASTVSSDVCRPATTSTNGTRCGGLNGWATTTRSGWWQAFWNALGPKPDELLASTTSGATASSSMANNARLTSSRSGPASITKSA